MNTSAIVTMIIICGFVWGGFLYLLTLAIRQERAVSNDTTAPERT